MLANRISFWSGWPGPITGHFFLSLPEVRGDVNLIALEGQTVTEGLWTRLEARDPKGDLEIITARLADGLILQVGKNTQNRGEAQVEVCRQPPYVVVAVKDSGVGIPPAEIPRIWDRLYRGDKSRSTSGLGLGLSLVKAVVEAHGGRVEVASAVGTGSLFTVYLPA